MNRSIAYALASALLFGASTPLAKQLLDQVPPLLLGGLLYLGAGLGLLLYRLLRDRGWRHPGLHGHDWGWLGGAIVVGGVVGTAALMFGLQLSSAASASLLLNLEAVFTALLAWLVFREHASRRVVTGMLAIVAGGLLLAWPTDPAATAAATATGAALVVPSAWAAASAAPLLTTPATSPRLPAMNTASAAATLRVRLLSMAQHRQATDTSSSPPATMASMPVTTRALACSRNTSQASSAVYTACLLYTSPSPRDS